MTGANDVATRWIDYSTGKLDSRKRPSLRAGNVYSSLNRIYSYGSHFEMGRIIETPDGKLAILNGDRYSVTTAQHQSVVRGAVISAELPYIIVPFSAIERAGIELDTVRPLEIRDDTTRIVRRSSPDLNDVPAYKRTTWDVDAHVERDLQRSEDGLYHWESSEHVLGASVFSAETSLERVIGTCSGGYNGSPDRCPPETGGYIRSRHPHEVTETYTERRFYVSGFDDQESRPLYFLAELPGRAYTYENALRMLRPEPVRRADRAGVSVVRQGDIFAIPADVTTRKLRKLGASIARRGHTVDVSGPVVVELGTVRLDSTRHEATEVATLPDGSQYARGCLYHMGGEHARRKMADGWARIVRNTVPRDPFGNPRAWTISGRVD